MHIHHDLAKPPLTLPLYVPADDDDGIAARLDLREVCAASSAELGTLLATPPNVFWSYVLHCAPIMAFVDSYLRFAPRHLGLSSSEAAELESEEAELRHNVLLVLLRLAQPAESAAVLSDAQWAETVYEHWVFSAPSLLDACALYGFSRTEQCRTLVGSVLASQPAYADDLAEALGAAAEALAQVCGRPAPAGAVKKLPLPSALDADGADEVALLAEWLQDCVGALHALLHTAAAPVAAALSHPPPGRTTGTQRLLGALQLCVEAALPLLRRRLRAARCAARPAALLAPPPSPPAPRPYPPPLLTPPCSKPAESSTCAPA
jgi:hypothetical protein